MIYKTRKELLDILRNTPKGYERSKILSIKENRNLIISSGASIVLYSGKLKNEKSPLKKLDNINIGVIHRLNAKTGNLDGIGSLGGLSERTNVNDFNNMTLIQKQNLLGIKDDIIIHNGNITLTNDINIIRINNVIRETKEELGNLGIYDFSIDKKQIQLIELNDIKDDNFAINIWDGKGDVWCITPYCHTLQIDENNLDILAQRSEDIHNHEQNSEAAKFSKIKLTHALKCFGNYSGINKLEDGRNANTDYRYPHEWMANWVLAASLLNHDEKQIVELYKDIQLQTPWKISFKKVSEKMGKDLTFVAQALKISPEVVEYMENFYTGNEFSKSNSRSF